MRHSFMLAAVLCATSCAALAAEPVIPGTTAGDDSKPVTKLASPDTVLATRGDAVLVVADMDAFVAHIPPRDRAAVVGTEERVSTVVQNLLMNRQLANEVRKQGLEQDPQVQREILLSTEKILARRGLTLYVEKQKQPDLEQLAKETYATEKGKFTTAESRTVQHILVNTKDRSDAEGLKLIKQIEEQARAPGADFQGLVDKYSDDGSKVQNRGYYVVDASMVGKMDPAFLAAANSLTKEGKITEPVLGMYGYHLILLQKFEPSRQLAFDEVKTSLIEQLRAAYVKRAEEEHTQQLRALDPEIDVEVAEGLKTRYLQAPLPLLAPRSNAAQN